MLAGLWPTAGRARMSATDLPCRTANSLKTSTARDSGYVLRRLQRDIPPTRRVTIDDRAVGVAAARMEQVAAVPVVP